MRPHFTSRQELLDYDSFRCYGIVISIPYFVIALVTGEARTKMTMSLSNHSRRIEIVAGVILIAVGISLILPIFGIRFYI